MKLVHTRLLTIELKASEPHKLRAEMEKLFESEDFPINTEEFKILYDLYQRLLEEGV